MRRETIVKTIKPSTKRTFSDLLLGIKNYTFMNCKTVVDWTETCEALDSEECGERTKSKMGNKLIQSI